MEENTMILAEDQYYSLDCHETQLNNNLLVVGTSGAGKTRSIVTPNILQAVGSYIISDPKGNLYDKYKNYLCRKGYRVMKLDFTDPKNSAGYNFFDYIRDDTDIIKIAHMLIYQEMAGKNADPFWDQASQLLLEAIISYLREFSRKDDQNLQNVLKLVSNCQADGDMEYSQSVMDYLIRDAEKRKPTSHAVTTYKRFRVAADKTLRSILISVNARLGLYDTESINQITKVDTIDIPSIGKRKTALFVVVSDTDRSLDPLANLFFTQAMNELCRAADKTREGALPVPVRFILDDFATNCKIAEFPRMISSIRSRGISTMLFIQAESQLTAQYGDDGRTIIGNCDTYMYLGGNDIDTAKAVAARCDLPVKKILYMPVGTNWIFRRGQLPINGKNFNLEQLLAEKEEELRAGHGIPAGIRYTKRMFRTV